MSAVEDDDALSIPDPFPHPPPVEVLPRDAIIPVEDEDIDEPDTGIVKACIESDPLRAQDLARQKMRAIAQKIDRKLSPSRGVRIPSGALKKP